MAIAKVPQDGKRLVSDCKNLLTQLGEVRSFRREVTDSVAQLVDRTVVRQLEEIPVEELNRDHRGFRVKTLRDSGFATVAEVLSAPAPALAAINGISDDGAIELRKAAKAIAAQARQGAKIRLSADDRTPESDRLLLALSRYRQGEESAQIAEKLVKTYTSPVQNAVLQLECSKNGLLWLFASKNKKLAAHRGYKTLYEAATGEFGIRGRNALETLRQTDLLTVAQSREAFTADPIGFLNTLETLCPGVVGVDVSGLPEGLAAEIQQEPFYPEGLRCTLRRYQEWGVKYVLHQKRVLLGDEMGLGKTVQAIAVMVSLRNTGATHFLVICPASVMENWCREIQKHSDLTPVKIHGDRRQEALARWQQSGGVAVTTYETTGFFDLPKEFRFAAAIVDEAHYIKNPQARRSQNVKKICGHTDRLLFMTGTALENRVDEMIILMSLLQPEIALAARSLASLSSAPQFRETVAPVYYRRRREDVLTELPDLIEKEQWCTLGQSERTVYRAAVLGNHFTEARRVSWNAPSPQESAKARRLLELADQAKEEGRKVIVFSFFLDTIARVISLMPDRCMEPINGSVSPQRRQEIVDEFQKAPPGAVLPAQIQAGGTGLNIQAASVVILCEPQLKPSIENQAISRAYRMGQTRNVLVHRLLCEDTVDEEITALLAQKQQAFDAFADESAAARESLELDSRTVKELMAREAQRIREEEPSAEPPAEPAAAPEA